MLLSRGTHGMKYGSDLQLPSTFTGDIASSRMNELQAGPLHGKGLAVASRTRTDVAARVGKAKYLRPALDHVFEEAPLGLSSRAQPPFSALS